MEVVVNDTNIFIDLYSIGLIDEFFKLPLSVHTIDLVLNEIVDDQQRKVLRCFVDSGLLKVGKFGSNEVGLIYELQNNAGGNVSFVDCAVWYYAEINKFILLTGDRQLRNKAISHNVTVKGILYIFDELVRYEVITPNCAVEKLKKLQSINQRLPRTLIQERIDRWSLL